MAYNPLQIINLTADLTLLWPFSFETQGTKLTDINNVIPTANGFKIIMPDATQALPGQNALFNNTSAFSFQIVASDGTTNIANVAAGQAYQVYLNNSQTSVGAWNAIFPGGTSSISSVAAISTTNSIAISGSPLTSPGGILDFGLPQSLLNLLAVPGTGVAVISATSPQEWKTISLVGGTNITVTNSDGIAGNPIFNLTNNLTGLTSAEISNITISADLIASNTANGNIQITTGGTGLIYLNGIQIDTNGNISNINNLTGIYAFAVFTDTLTIISNDIGISTSVNIASITGSHGAYTVTFVTPAPTANYGVLVTVFTPGGATPPVYHGTVPSASRTTAGFIIQVVDASGEPVLSLPSGLTFAVIYSPT